MGGRGMNRISGVDECDFGNRNQHERPDRHDVSQSKLASGDNNHGDHHNHLHILAMDEVGGNVY